MDRVRDNRVPDFACPWPRACSYGSEIPLMNGDTMMPWKTLSATLNVGTSTEGWNLAGPAHGEEWEAPRSFYTEVFFAAPFAYPPVVHLSLTGFDIDQAYTSRLVVRALDITANGFKAEISTWHDSRVYSTEVAWLAIGP